MEGAGRADRTGPAGQEAEPAPASRASGPRTAEEDGGEGIPKLRSGDVALFAGSASRGLAEGVAALLGLDLARCEAEQFPDGELSVRLLESVRGRDVYVVQSTAPPVNDHLMELVAFTDACRRSAARRIVAVIPYYGYSRADKRHGRREPIMASAVAGILQAVGVDQVVTIDLHTTQIEGFFHIPVDSLTAVPRLCGAVGGRLPADAVVVSPDAGRVPLATRYAERLDLSLAVLHKRRTSGTETAVTHLVGDVEGRTCLLVDDMISTGGTLVESVRALGAAGAESFVVAATHGLLLGGAMGRLRAEGVREVLVTDTIEGSAGRDGARIVTVAPVVAAALARLALGRSLEELS